MSQDRRSGCRCQPTIGLRVCAKQPLPNGLFNKRERVVALVVLQLQPLGREARRRSAYLLGLRSATWLAQALCKHLAAFVRQLMMSSRCARSAASARISACRSLSKAARAKLLGASLGFAGVLFYAAEDIGCSIYQVESCCAVPRAEAERGPRRSSPLPTDAPKLRCVMSSKLRRG